MKTILPEQLLSATRCRVDQRRINAGLAALGESPVADRGGEASSIPNCARMKATTEAYSIKKSTSIRVKWLQKHSCQIHSAPTHRGHAGLDDFLVYHCGYLCSNINVVLIPDYLKTVRRSCEINDCLFFYNFGDRFVFSPPSPLLPPASPPPPSTVFGRARRRGDQSVCGARRGAYQGDVQRHRGRLPGTGQVTIGIDLISNTLASKPQQTLMMLLAGEQTRLQRAMQAITEGALIGWKKI